VSRIPLLPSPETTLVILLGASEWPNAPIFKGSPAFKNSSSAFIKYFIDAEKFGLQYKNLLNLFDSAQSPFEISKTLSQFFEQRCSELAEAGSPVKDLIVYFIGHGGFTNDQDYCLAIRCTDMDDLLTTSLSIKWLAQKIKNHVRYIRHYIILDCCFAAAAFDAFQSGGPAQVAVAQALDAFSEPEEGSGFPNKGTALLCSSGHNKPSLLAPDESSTMFSEAVFHVLMDGDPSVQGNFSLYTLGQLAWDYLRVKYEGSCPRPEVHSPDQSEGNVATVKIFPNPSRPSINVLHAPPTNLQVKDAHLIGREKELAEIEDLGQRKEARLITLIGTAGVGKSILARHGARMLMPHFDDGIFLVRFSSHSDPTIVANDIMRALRIGENAQSIENKNAASPEENGSGPRPDLLINYLRGKQVLLLLDNFEQVIPAANPLIYDLIKECPSLKLLVTSQELLQVRAEELQGEELPINVEPLDLPKPEDLESLEKLRKNPAIQLFTHHGARVKKSFRLTPDYALPVYRICKHLDGLPLAIEIAAAQIEARTPGQILEDLIRYGILDAVDEGKLRRTFDSTFNLLEENEQNLFKRLSVFANGCTFEAIKAIYQGMGQSPKSLGQELTRLVRKNVLKHEVRENKVARYTMLQPIQDYALDCLNKDQAEALLIRQRAAEYYLNMAKQAERRFTSPKRRAWLDQLEEENANIRSVIQWSETQEIDSIRLELAGSLFWFWNFRAHFSEGRKLLVDVLKQTRRLGYTESRAKSLYGLGGLAFLQGDYKSAYRWLLRSVRVWRKLGAKSRTNHRGLGYSLIVLGMVAANLEKLIEARNYEQESVNIFEGLKEKWGLALSLNDLGNVVIAQGKAIAQTSEDNVKLSRAFYSEGLEYYQKSLLLWKELGDDWGLPLTLTNLGTLACEKKSYNDAREYFEEALAIHKRSGDKWGRATALRGLGQADIGLWYFERAAEEFYQSFTLHFELARAQLIAECLEGLAEIAGELGHPAQGVHLLGAARKERDLHDLWKIPRQREEYAEICEKLWKQLNNEKLFDRAIQHGHNWRPEEVEKYVNLYKREWTEPSSKNTFDYEDEEEEIYKDEDEKKYSGSHLLDVERGVS
jgi:predicted ATPase